MLQFPFLYIFTDSRDYAVPDVTKSALVVALPPIYPPQPPVRGQASILGAVDTPPPTYDALYAAADVINAQGLNIPSLQVGHILIETYKIKVCYIKLQRERSGLVVECLTRDRGVTALWSLSKTRLS